MVLLLRVLAQPNNNHNHNNKTTITVVGLRPSKRWEPNLHPSTHHTNRAIIWKQKLLTLFRSLFQQLPRQFETSDYGSWYIFILTSNLKTCSVHEENTCKLYFGPSLNFSQASWKGVSYLKFILRVAFWTR